MTSPIVPFNRSCEKLLTKMADEDQAQADNGNARTERAIFRKTSDGDHEYLGEYFIYDGMCRENGWNNYLLMADRKCNIVFTAQDIWTIGAGCDAITLMENVR